MISPVSFSIVGSGVSKFSVGDEVVGKIFFVKVQIVVD